MAPVSPGLSSRWQRFRWDIVIRWAPFVVLPVYLAVVLAVQPNDHLGPPDRWPFFGQPLYDDYDVTVMALRGLNAHVGRPAGRLGMPPHISDAEFAEKLQHDQPLASSYYLEYPHTALWLFRLPFLFQSSYPPVPAAVLDASHGNLIMHRPTREEDVLLWRALRQTTRLYRTLMGICLLGLILTFRAGYDPEGRLSSSGLLLLLPGVLYFTFNRFDVVPALLTALSLACLGRRWWVGSAALLAAATLVKVYPVLLVPLVLRYLWTQRQGLTAWLFAYVVTGALLLSPHLLREGPQAVWAPYQWQLTRDLDWATGYGYVFPRRLAENDLLGRTFRQGSLLLVAGLLCWRRILDLGSLLRRSAVVLIVFLALAVFWSPQWILWLTPFLLPLFSQSRALAVLFIALDFVLPMALTSPSWLDLEIYARFALFLALILVLLWTDWHTENEFARTSARGTDTTWALKPT
jgi:hypothetical protein